MPNKSQKGVSLYLTILIMSVLLGVGLGISTLLIRQIRMIKGVGDSVVAFYAADSGIEKAMYALYKGGYSGPPDPYGPGDINFSENLDISDPSYTYTVQGYSPSSDPDSKCPSSLNDYYCIQSVGTYKEVRRAIEVAR